MAKPIEIGNELHKLMLKYINEWDENPDIADEIRETYKQIQAKNLLLRKPNPFDIEELLSTGITIKDYSFGKWNTEYFEPEDE